LILSTIYIIGFLPELSSIIQIFNKIINFSKVFSFTKQTKFKHQTTTKKIVVKLQFPSIIRVFNMLLLLPLEYAYELCCLGFIYCILKKKHFYKYGVH
jgi:hypothetical protein